jgi:hypothetical protein
VTPYQQILEIARQQVAAALAGDLDYAIELMNARAVLLQTTGDPDAADKDAIRETLKLDYELAGAIRQRMLSLRAEAVATQHAQSAIGGYRVSRGRVPAMLDAQR